ncbi:conserved hypothetical protein [Tenacibaculum crassostreae]
MIMKIKHLFSLLFILTFIFFIKCNKKESDELTDWRKISNSNQWTDYNYFVQNYPESKKIETAIHNSISLFKINNGFCGRFNLKFSSYSKDSLLCDGYIIPYDSIKIKTTNYLINSVYVGYFNKIKIPNTKKEALISKGLFDIELPKNGINQNFKKALIEITKGIYDYKKYLAKKWFKKSFDNLTSLETNFINDNVYNRLIFFEYTPYNPTPLEPTEKDTIINEL